MFRFFQQEYSSRARWLWLLFSWLAGVFITLAAPLSIPGGAVERVQANLTNLNVRVLLGSELLSLLQVVLWSVVPGAVIFLTVLALVFWQPRSGPPARGRASWLLLALPMLLVWGAYLLAFWPAMMSGDSFNQWQQARTGHFESGHPLLHTLFLWLMMQVWDSPALVAMAQSLVLALLVAWGLGQLRRCGLPGWAAWGASWLFALSPINGAMVNTIWKDIPYSIAFLAFSLLILFLSLDEQRWLNYKGTALMLGLAGVGVGLFRHNGLVVVPVVMLLLVWVYRDRRGVWKIFALAMGIITLAWVLVNGPLNTLLKVEKSSAITGSIALHHIAAHLHYGTQPTPEEKALLEQVMPLSKWSYNCYSINPLQSDPAFNTAAAVAETPDLYRVALQFFLRHPTVDINHTLCAGSLIYRVFQEDESYLLAMQIIDIDGGVHYLPANSLGFTEAPRLPWLNAVLQPMLRWMASRERNWLFWRPALPLYLLLLFGTALMLRARSWKMGLFLLPALVQSAALLVTNISQSFRYQYPVYLVYLLALVLLFLPLRQTQSRSNSTAPA